MQRMKVYLVLFVLMTLTGVFLYNKIGSENKTPVTPITKTATPTTKDTLIGDITRDFSKKYKKPTETITITLDTKLDSYAKGLIKFKDENGGGMWFAVKINGVWQLIYDGNGIISCGILVDYPEFPNDLIPQCFDEYKNTLINR